MVKAVVTPAPSGTTVESNVVVPAPSGVMVVVVTVVPAPSGNTVVLVVARPAPSGTTVDVETIVRVKVAVPMSLEQKELAVLQ